MIAHGTGYRAEGTSTKQTKNSEQIDERSEEICERHGHGHCRERKRGTRAALAGMQASAQRVRRRRCRWAKRRSQSRRLFRNAPLGAAEGSCRRQGMPAKLQAPASRWGFSGSGPQGKGRRPVPEGHFRSHFSCAALVPVPEFRASGPITLRPRLNDA